MRKKPIEIDKKFAAWDKAEVPIIIGVSAHRNIRMEYESQVKDRVREFLTSVRELCPHSPIYMLNGLAKSGDQLCADVAAELGIKLIVALPFEREKYVNTEDFPNGTDKKFNGYFENGQVIDSFIVPDMEHAGGDEFSRDYRFRQQGIYVATNCHILLALWDGKEVVDKRKEGGTNAAVGFALKNSYYQPNGMEFSPSEDGAVAWVFSPRERTTYGENIDVFLKYLVPTDVMDEIEKSDGKTAGNEAHYYETSDRMPDKLTDVLLHTDRYNRDYLEYCAELGKKEDRQDGYLLDEAEYDAAPRKAQAMVHCHNMASKLSAINKKRNLHAVMALAVLGMCMLLSFMVYDQLAYGWTVALCIVTVVVLVFAFLLLFAGEKVGRGKINFDVHARFIEYRALSEALRVQYYMSMYGIEECVCRYFTWSHKSLMPWVRKAVIALNVGRTVAAWENDCEERAQDNTQVIFSGRTDARGIFENKLFNKWVGHDKHRLDYNDNGQLGYHLMSVSKKRAAIRRRNTVRKIALIVTLFAYVTLFVCELLPIVDLGASIAGSVFTWRMLLKCTLSTFVAVTFLINYYYGKQSLDLIQTDSVNMIRLYRTAIDRANKIYETFDKISDCDNAIRSLICELAREQLIENVTWVAYNKDNNIEMPM